MRIPKTATFILAAVTVLVTLLIGLVGENDRAAILMGVLVTLQAYVWTSVVP